MEGIQCYRLSLTTQLSVDLSDLGRVETSLLLQMTGSEMGKLFKNDSIIPGFTSQRIHKGVPTAVIMVVKEEAWGQQRHRRNCIHQNEFLKHFKGDRILSSFLSGKLLVPGFSWVQNFCKDCSKDKISSGNR